uniref:Esterase n=1 Tax=Pyrrhocoris apterus TaxID=37000 RepID=M4WL56_PYRAP|nr:esterase [Pyrrhocoris apterus]
MLPSWLKVIFVLSQLMAACLSVTLDTRLGQIEGKEMKTKETGRTYYSFTGVPYAKPPVGELRLRNPVPQGKWNGKLDATKIPKQCSQVMVFIYALRNETLGAEDCLYLNIFTPTTDAKKKLPVLIYIHGGGFRCGHTGPVEGETNFMEEDVVLVTLQYRVGTLGFLSTEDAQIPGNFGLKDQAMALKWISENIDQYGGDPLSMTVFGESAGGASVHYQITSPLSRDLLKGAIALSGVTDCPWALAKPGEVKELTEKVATIVGCEYDERLLECLQGLDVNKLTGVERNFMVWDFHPGVVFRPVIELPNEGAFLTEDPSKIKVTKPLIVGQVTGEGLLSTASLLNQDESVIVEFENNVDKYLGMLTNANPSSPKFSKFINRIKEKYLNDKSKTTVTQLEDMFTEYYFSYPIILTLKRHAGPMYAYIFEHRAEKSLTDLQGSVKINSEKPCHADELLSLFDWRNIFPDTKGRQEDKNVSKRLINYWINFAKYQNPTPKGSDVIWSQYKKNNYLIISTNEDKMENVDKQDLFNFWQSSEKLLEARPKEEL